MEKPVLFVVAAGPGVSGSVARRFAREGYDAALIGLHETVLEELAESLRGEAVGSSWRAVDITDAEAFTAAVTGSATPPGGSTYCTSTRAPSAEVPLELTPAELDADMHVGLSALLTAVQSARPFMRSGGRVTATGSMAADEPDPGPRASASRRPGCAT